MIEVKPILEQELLKPLFEKHRLEMDDCSGGVAAKFGEEVLGYCLYTLTDTSIVVHILEPQEDAFLADGILRSALHVAAERSAMDARYSQTAPESLLVNLGFVTDRENKVLNIDLLFGGCCSCKE